MVLPKTYWTAYKPPISTYFREFAKNRWITRNMISAIDTLIPEQMIAEVERDIQEWEAYEKVLKDFKSHVVINTVLTPEFYAEFILKTQLFLLISDFENYLFQSVKFIFTSYPKMLARKKVNIPFSQLFEKSSKDLIEEKIEKTIQDNLRSYFEFIKFLDSFDIHPRVTKDEIKRANEILQVRNLYAHNNGIVNSIFLNKFGDTPFSIGEKYPLLHKTIGHSIIFLEELVKRIDVAFIDQFKEFPLVEIDSNS